MPKIHWKNGARCAVCHSNTDSQPDGNFHVHGYSDTNSNGDR